MHSKNFTFEVSEKLKYYVYRLVDPRNGETFYVGRGKNNRVFAHINCALKDYHGENYLSSNAEEDDVSAKYKTIREINRIGLQVIHIIHRHGLTEKEAKEVEAALIDCYSGLTNIQGGYAGDRGVTNTETLIKDFSREIYEEPDDIRYIIIKTSWQRVSLCNGDIYEATRKSWVININNAKKYKYVFSVINGVVQKVYSDLKWKESENGRYEFVGEEAPQEISDRFVGKRTPEYYRKKGTANPVLYKKAKNAKNINKEITLQMK